MINFLFILKQNFFFNKDCSKVKDKKNLLHKWEGVARKRHTVVKIFTNPPFWCRPYMACICELQSDSQRCRHHQNSGKRGKNFNISFNLNILAFLAIKLGQILFKQKASYLFGMIFRKKKFNFEIL